MCVCLRQAESHVFVYAEVTYPAQVITLGPVYTGSHAMTRLLYKPSCLLTHFPQNTRGREWNLTNLSNLKHLICLIYEQTQHKYPTVSHFKLVLYRSVLYKTIIFNSSKFFFFQALKATGLRTGDPRLKECMEMLKVTLKSTSDGVMLDRHLFKKWVIAHTSPL